MIGPSWVRVGQGWTDEGCRVDDEDDDDGDDDCAEGFEGGRVHGILNHVYIKYT
jgi:hypothetical protein